MLALVWMPSLAAARPGLGMTAIAPLLVPMLLGGLLATASVIRWLDRLGELRLSLVGGGTAVLGLLSGGPLRHAAARALPRDAQGVAQGRVAWITDLGLLGGCVLLRLHRLATAPA